ncbi:hypothetical protein Celaphus_00000393 [Cervus elaphus hippelaphus]|uniref:Uncharacterized protein n=1 Tax=Cervus elaphus hippelaphus TaxID=46360 RepID=A0A212D9Q9_CEREH|nr:hypothetical protein Celaphus_00000393 [Cervus elaphus hippelaphus]
MYTLTLRPQSLRPPGMRVRFRLLSPRPSLLTPTSDARTHASPQKPLDLKQLKQRAAAIPPIVSPGPPSHGQDPHPAQPPRDPVTVTSWWGDNKSG